MAWQRYFSWVWDNTARVWVWETAKDMRKEWSEDRLTDLAAATSFFTLLSIPAVILAFVSGLGSLESLLGEGLAEDARRSLSDYVATTFASDTLTDTVNGLFEKQRSGLLTISLAVALLSVARGFAGLVRALDAAYDIGHPRSWLDVRLTGMALGLSTLAFAGGSLWFVYGLWPAVGDHEMLVWLGRVILVALLIGWAAAIFHVGPDHSTPWRYDLPGALLTALLWAGLLRGFAVYVSFSNDSNGAVGLAGAALLAFTLVYLLNLSLLVGAELNAIVTQRAGVGQAPRRLHHRLRDRANRRTSLAAKTATSEEGDIPRVAEVREHTIESG